MIKSMTAFANSEKSYVEDKNGELLLSWEIRSVNHRYLDANIYLPEGFSSVEAQLKEFLRKKLGRGKVDAKLVFKRAEDSQQSELKINQNAVKSLINAHDSLKTIAQQVSSTPLTQFSTMEILQYPGVLERTEFDYTEYNKDVIATFKEVLVKFIESREEEGARLKEMLVLRASSIQEIVAQVKKRRPEVVNALRDKVIKKISELAIEADNSRLEQELAIQAQRLDVDEELDRLESHIDELFAVLERNEPVGRRLDFLMQELHREANTLGSKANDAETTKASVELKVLIEQMREQVMNIE